MSDASRPDWAEDLNQLFRAKDERIATLEAQLNAAEENALTLYDRVKELEGAHKRLKELAELLAPGVLQYDTVIVVVQAQVIEAPK